MAFSDGWNAVGRARAGACYGRRMTREQEAARRLCPACGAAEPLGDGPAWPPGWRCGACRHACADTDGIPLLAPALADRDVGMDPASFAFLAEAEKRHFWFRQRNRLIAGLVHRHFPDARSYLEVGCGNGVVMAAIAADRNWDRLVGSELHPSALRFARGRLPAAELLQMDARRIPFRAAFDLVGAFDVIEHIEEDEAVLAAMAGAARPGAGIVVAVPQHPLLWSGADDAAYHVRRYRRGELEGKMERAGLRVIRSTSFVSLLLPLMLLSRSLDRSRRGDTRSVVGREFEISRLMNATLGGVTAVEVTATLAGLSWPAGGSRIVVATRAAG
jgi:SAM-dependent methyltransferase